MTTAFYRFKPITIDVSGVKSFNWKWLLQRAPILALGVDSSYNVAKYIGLDGTPLVIQIVTGVTFDLIFVGLIALADQFRSAKIESVILFWGINTIAMLVAAILGTLAYSTGLYVNVTLESFTRGTAYPLLGLLYNLYYHFVTGEIVAKTEQDRKELNAKPFVCEFCGARYETVKQKSGHLARCQQKTSKA